MTWLTDILFNLRPALMMLLSILLDTAVIPVFYSGNYLPLTSLVVVMLIGIQLKRMRGMFYGLIAGLLLDISAGTLGMKFFAYIAIGFLSGFLLEQQPEINREMTRRDRLELILIRFIWIFAMVLLYELAMLAIQYAFNAIFKWTYLLNALIRTLIQTVLTLLCYEPLSLFFTAHRADRGKRNTREERSY